MKDWMRKPGFWLGLLLVVGLLIYVGFRGGSLGVPMPWGDASLAIPGPDEQVKARDAGIPAAERSVVGHWHGGVTFFTRPLIISHTEVAFLRSGNYEFVSQEFALDPGRWTQDGSQISLTSSSGTIYHGTIKADFLRPRAIYGVTTNPQGTFYFFED